MIVTKLQGGLGNQLFQWAVTKSLSVKYDSDYKFELSYFKSSDWNLELDKFKKIVLGEYDGEIPLNLISDNFYFKEIPNNSLLNGYWQSEKYFISVENLIRDDLKIEENLKNYILSKYPFLNENTVSLHVRRGDYVGKQDYHPLQNVQYYKDAYDLINDNNLNVVILSNDIDWCKQNLNFNNMFFIEEETNITDLYIMSVCQNNIIANSSFSWWGAWLNDNKEKKVVAPKKWFGSAANLYDGDIVPEKWIKL